MVKRRSLKVAVIGAGVAGLTAARSLLSEGHHVTVFEKSRHVGGTWVYDERVESDPTGLDPARSRVHGSLYHSLRTNLPRPLMGFSDYPFPDGPPSGAFPSHDEVLSFIKGFALDFGLLEWVRFGSEVVSVGPGPRADEWVVEALEAAEKKVVVEAFEAVVVCNGHYSEPMVADVPGIDKWPGKQIHSHNYRVPEPFRDQTVVLIGSSASAYDISREISVVAKEVHLSSRSADEEFSKVEGQSNIWQHSSISCVDEDRMVAFHDGSSIRADVIFYCTGYKYSFPFLKTNGFISVEDNRVGPLYQHVFPPKLSPSISFVGLPQRVIPFLTIDLQSKWVAQVLSSKAMLPPEEEMMASIKALYMQMETTGTPKHHTHRLHPYELDYMNWLAAQVGVPPLDKWKEQMHLALIQGYKSKTNAYRDNYDNEYWNRLGLSEAGL
ncbi:Flavin-containing monooxygenase FMO GS-OX5 [Acorus calamus]|uniref:Flavin-containing monooxygenase n=1 Tax=Acorus calamus TaxID=4465 RepID=A0AAV9DWC3_ACOCL|nr:Flavin-containing monooxygenase FMO GS-OX5 [Acorus calamus]